MGTRRTREIPEGVQERGYRYGARVWGPPLYTVNLYSTIGDLLDKLVEFEDSKALRMRIRDQIVRSGADHHPYYIKSILQLARSHTRLGEWMEAQTLHEEALKHRWTAKLSSSINHKQARIDI